MNNIKSYFSNFFKSCDTNTKSIKIPFWGLLSGTFNYFTDNVRTFFKLALFYGFILAFLASILHFTYLCNYFDAQDILGCSTSEFQFILFMVLKFFIIGIFLSKWVDYVFDKKAFNFKEAYLPSLKDVFASVSLFVFVAINLIPLVSLYLLYIRVPNPNWQIEMVYFTVVSIGFIVPFLLMRLYAVWGLIFTGQPIPCLKNIWQVSKGNIPRIIFSLFFVSALFLLLMMTYYTNFRQMDFEALSYQPFVVEYIYELLILVFVVFFINNLVVQKNYLLEGEVNEQ